MITVHGQYYFPLLEKSIHHTWGKHHILGTGGRKSKHHKISGNA